jgi:two-component system nitrogen regulation response regulator GlnG
VRQLENLCHWLTVLAPAQVVKVEDLPLELRQEPAARAAPAPAAEAAVPVPPPVAAAVAGGPTDWAALLGIEVERRMRAQLSGVMEALAREFESTVLRTALRLTHGRRIEAANRLGVGRNTVTRKIQELGLED